MAFDFHSDSTLYYKNQFLNSRDYIIPFIEEYIQSPGRVLEIGCAHGGVLKAFTERGWSAVGIDMNPSSIEKANNLAAQDVAVGSIRFIANDIYKISPEELEGKFDLIILKDTIEHIHNQEKIIGYLKKFLTENGIIYFGFPPWYMPFGGHQQICRNKIMGILPYYHLLPMGIYSWILKVTGEPDNIIRDLQEIKTLGISIERFERLIKRNFLDIVKKRFYLINPIYEFKFGLKPRILPSLFSKIPFLRNFITTGVFYLVKVK